MIGVLEMQKFGLMFFPDCKKSTFTEESCGIADVITSCAGGRNRLCAEQFVKTGKVCLSRASSDILAHGPAGARIVKWTKIARCGYR
jgi:glycerol-3-phosphate dehydrogenase